MATWVMVTLPGVFTSRAKWTTSLTSGTVTSPSVSSVPAVAGESGRLGERQGRGWASGTRW